MSDKLIDPAKDKWAIVEERDDGSALRNDGQELRSRHKNPWYVLATIYGEPGSGIDQDLAARNRRAWNLWSCQALSAEARKTLAEKMGLGEDELGGAWEAERPEIERRFRERMGEGAELPETKRSLVNFGAVYLPGVSFAKFHFSFSTTFATAHIGADFRFAHFSFPANFTKAYFASSTYFTSAHFASTADFPGAHFASYAYFNSVHFAAHFASLVHFASTANFASAHFSDPVYFNFARFGDTARFTSARFSDLADFSSATFRSATYFDDAIFLRRAPVFSAAEVYQNTTFTLEDENWPKPEAKTAREDASAYVRLKQLMVDAHKPDDALFFLRREFRCKLLTEKKRERIWIWLFWKLSHFGYSIWRPFLGLAALITAFWLIYLVSFIWEAVLHNGARTGAEAFGLSFSNSFGFLGFNRVYFGAEYFQQLPAWIKVAGAVQTIMGIAFLFFLGLGLRNRFRLK